MGRRLHAWLSLSRADRRSLLALAIALPLVAGTLRIAGLCRTQTWLQRLAGSGPMHDAGTIELRAAQRLAQLAAIAGRRGALPVTCLPQSLLVFALLRRRGLSPELKLGVRKIRAAVDAHAWVELQGVALGQKDLMHVPFVPRAGLNPARESRA